LFVRLAYLQFAFDRSDESPALASLESARRIRPDYWEIYSALGYIHASRERNPEAIEAAKRALELNPNDVQSMNNLAWAIAKSQNSKPIDLEQAKSYAAKAVQISRAQKPEFLDTYAEVLSLLGEKKEAIEQIHKAAGVASASEGAQLRERLTQIAKRDAKTGAHQ